MADKIHLNDIEDLFTDKLANEGIRFPIRTADGRETDGWLLLYHADSDHFEKAAVAHERRKKDIEQIADPEEKREAIKDADRRLTASMVGGWSFAKPCTQEAVIELLRRAKYLSGDIDAIAFDRRRFYGGASSNSPATPKRPTDSTDQPAKDPPSP